MLEPITILYFVLGYFALLLLLSIVVNRKSTSNSFFNGDRQSPWYIVAFGMIGATLSGVTFISVPGEVANSSFYYLQFVLGNFVGYMLIANFLLPYYYRKNVVSIYATLEERLGTSGHKTTSFFFIISKLIGAAFRLFLAVLVLQMAISDPLGISFEVTVVASLVLIWLYTFRSGIKVVVWSDAIQTTVLLFAVIATVVWIFRNSANPQELMSSIELGKNYHIFNFDWRDANFFLKQFIAGIFITLALNGFDQDIVQKNLTCKNASQARKNMMWFSVWFVVAILLFLILGAMLLTYAKQNGLEIPSRTDQLFPQLALNSFSKVIAVLFILGISAAAFSSADSATTALTTAICVDFVEISKMPQEFQTRVRIWTHVGVSFLLFGIIMAFYEFNDESVVVAIFKAAGYTYGPILGIFTFAFFSKREPIRFSIFPIAVAAPFATWGLTILVEHLKINYQFGFELIIINAAITWLLLLFFSWKKLKRKQILEENNDEEKLDV